MYHTNRSRYVGCIARLSGVAVTLWGASAVRATPEVQVEIDPDEFEVSATTYYPTYGQVPSKMADNSGLSSPVLTGMPVPASESLYPTHDTVLGDMYRSGKDTHPDLFFSLGSVYTLSSLHYWNFNGDNKASHPSGGDKETTDDGINQVEIDTSTNALGGPWTPVGTYTLAQAPNLATYTGQTLALGTSVQAQFVRLHVLTNFSSAGVDQSGYFGLSEIRFEGSAVQWNANVSGNWSDATNWQGGVPNTAGAVANFMGAINHDVTISTDVPVTVGTMNFDNSHSYTIDGPNTITLANSGTSVTGVNVINGNHTILAPLSTSGAIVFNVSHPDNSLIVRGDITTGAGGGVSKAGQGLLITRGLRADGLTVSAGTMQISAAATPNAPENVTIVKNLAFTSPFLSPVATLNLTNNAMIVDYATVPLISPRIELQKAQITSSSADATHRIGYADNATLGVTTFAGHSVDATSLLMKYTFAGDANLDGQVDVTDLGALASNWQSSTAVWTGGDFDYDGIVNVTDLGMLATNWQAGVGSPLGPGSLDSALAAVGLGGASVPEPVGTVSLVLVAALGGRRVRRVRRLHRSA